METTAKSNHMVTVLLLFVMSLSVISHAEPTGTAFTYQGRLSDAGSPADNFYDFQFKLHGKPNVIV